VAHLPPGPPLYPAEQVTDITERELAAELVRDRAPGNRSRFGNAHLSGSMGESAQEVAAQRRLAQPVGLQSEAQKETLTWHKEMKWRTFSS